MSASGRDWDYGDNIHNHFKFDFTKNFDEQIVNLKSRNGGSFCISSHNYYVLRELFYGNTLDDYQNRPEGTNGYPIYNVRSRIAQLKHEWNICIGSRRVEGAQYKEYRIYMGNM